MAALGLSSFELLGEEFSVPPRTYLARGACNPEKDLVLLVHRVEKRDIISLWKLQGSKRWEVDAVGNFDVYGYLLDVAWSPDGDKFALGYSTRRVTVHDVLDGCEEFRATSSSLGEPGNRKVVFMTWLKMPWRYFWDEDISPDPPPQLYPREYDVPGSAFYVLKQLPRLDHKEPLIERMNDELYIVDNEWQQRPQNKEVPAAHRAPRHLLPSTADGWPALPLDTPGSSIAPPITEVDAEMMKETTERWKIPQSNTCLFAGDNHGTLYPFIHGTYSAGSIEIKPALSHPISMIAHNDSAFISRLCIESHVSSLRLRELNGCIFSKPGDDRLTFGSDYRLRDVMRISTVAKELVIYAGRTSGEAALAWYGGVAGQEGAREWNQKWCRLIESLQSRGDVDETDELLKPKGIKAELTYFLLTGAPLSNTLSDNLEHGSQTTERVRHSTAEQAVV